ncbi:MAG: murein DD-endopeptidase MepM/ murein hydrolase activator NlpD, partial [Myxococcota bacterium]
RRLLNQMVIDDEERIRNYHKVVQRYREARIVHEKELAELNAVEEKISDARTRLERDKAIKLALLESVRGDKLFYAKAGRDLDKAADDLQERILNFEEWKNKRLWFRDLKGQYMNPVPGGRIKKGYGKKTHPKFGTVTLQRGIDIIPGRKNVRTVRVIYWGKVVFAGWLRGYGRTVIVDHTKGDYTLYAHLSKMTVKKGDMLKSRQAIGTLGRTGSLEGEHLYFELRIDGKPVDPMRWLR